MLKISLAALALALMAALQFSYAQISDFPDHNWVYSQNMGVAESSPLSTPPSWVHPTKPSVFQPIEWAFIELSPASPSVGDHISNKHPPDFFWVWGERHAPSLTYTYSLSPSCDPSQIKISEFGKPGISGTLKWSLPGASIVQSLDEHSKPLLANPLAKDAWESLRTAEGENHTPILPLFSISFVGSVSVPYLKEVEEHYLVKSSDAHGNVIEHCESRFSTSVVFYRFPVASSRNYFIEHGDPLFLKLRPADLEQLSLASGFDSAQLSNRRAFSTKFMPNNSLALYTRWAHYSFSKDEVGFWNIERREGVQEKWADGIPSEPFLASVKSNSSTFFIEPIELDEKQRSFAYQYFQAIKYPLDLGFLSIAYELEDDFGDHWNSSFLILTRSPSAISGVVMENSSLILQDERLKDLPNAQLQPLIQNISKPGLNAQKLPSSDFWRQSLAFYFAQAPVLLERFVFVFLGIFIVLSFWMNRKLKERK